MVGNKAKKVSRTRMKIYCVSYLVQIKLSTVVIYLLSHLPDHHLAGIIICPVDVIIVPVRELIPLLVQHSSYKYIVS